MRTRTRARRTVPPRGARATGTRPPSPTAGEYDTLEIHVEDDGHTSMLRSM